MVPLPGIVEIDLHGLTVRQAQATINAALRRSKGVYRLRLIHGFHGGTAIRDMIRRQYGKKPGVLRVEFGLNGGETDIVLREFL